MGGVIEVGDFVCVNWNTLTWEVLELRVHPDAFGGPRESATLKSGQTGRHRQVWVSDLRPHTKGSQIIPSFAS